MAKAAWGNACKMWLARSAGRHGHGEEGKRSRGWQRSLKEAKARHELKESGKLELSEKEKKALHHGGDSNSFGSRNGEAAS